MVEARLPFVVASETTLSPTAGGVGAPMAPSPEVGESVRPLTDDRPERSRRRSLVAQRGPRNPVCGKESSSPRLSPSGRPGRRLARRWARYGWCPGRWPHAMSLFNRSSRAALRGTAPGAGGRDGYARGCPSRAPLPQPLHIRREVWPASSRSADHALFPPAGMPRFRLAWAEEGRWRCRQTDRSGSIISA